MRASSRSGVIEAIARCSGNQRGGWASPAESTSLSTRAGCRRQVSSATTEPPEMPTRCASPPASAIAPRTVSTAAASVKGPSERPWPGRSGANTRRISLNPSTWGAQAPPLEPNAWTSTIAVVSGVAGDGIGHPIVA